MIFDFCFCAQLQRSVSVSLRMLSQSGSAPYSLALSLSLFVWRRRLVDDDVIVASMHISRRLVKESVCRSVQKMGARACIACVKSSSKRFARACARVVCSILGVAAGVKPWYLTAGCVCVFVRWVVRSKRAPAARPAPNMTLQRWLGVYDVCMHTFSIKMPFIFRARARCAVQQRGGSELRAFCLRCASCATFLLRLARCLAILCNAVHICTNAMQCSLLHIKLCGISVRAIFCAC